MAGIPIQPTSVADIEGWLVISKAGILDLNLPAWLNNLLLSTAPVLSTVAGILYGRTNAGVIVELTGYTTDFAMNDIPTASATVAVGFNMQNPQLVSAIHYLSRYFQLFLQASIWTKVRPTYNTAGFDVNNNNWPANPFRVFDGYIIGTGFRKTDRSVDFVLQLTHWLSNLNFSSVLARSSSPVNPGQISFSPSIPSVNSQSSGAINSDDFRNGTYLTQLISQINNQTVFTDLWSNVGAVPLPNIIPPNAGQDLAPLFANGSGGIKNWLYELSLQDRINWQQFQTGLCGGTIPVSGEQKNIEALSAIRRIEPLSIGYMDGVPLALQQNLGNQNIAVQIAMALSYQMPNALANSTLWDKIVGEFGSEFLFSLIPQVEKALIVPFNPGLRTPWTTIYASEFDYYEQGHNIPRPLRGVGLFVGREFASGGLLSLNQQPVYSTIGAYYENPDRLNGMVVFKKAPRWISTVVLPGLWPASGPGVNIATAVNPIVNLIGNVASILGLGNKQPKDLIAQAQNSWCQFARSLYIQEILRGRSCKISGRLRFDVAPGSIVRVEEPVEPFVAARANLPRSFIYAQVLRVSHMVNSEGQKAGTALQLGFVRTEQENKDDSYSLSSHPIWANNWSGAPLVTSKEFYQGTIKTNYK